MTSVFSGGIAYEFFDSPNIQSAHWGYGLVREESAVVGKGLTKLADFHGLKVQLQACDAPSRGRTIRVESREEASQTFVDEAKDLPPLSSHWMAGHVLPYTLADWSGVQRALEEKAWVDVNVEEVDKFDLNMRQRVISA